MNKTKRVNVVNFCFLPHTNLTFFWVVSPIAFNFFLPQYFLSITISFKISRTFFLWLVLFCYYQLFFSFLIFFKPIPSMYKMSNPFSLNSKLWLWNFVHWDVWKQYQSVKFSFHVTFSSVNHYRITSLTFRLDHFPWTDFHFSLRFPGCFSGQNFLIHIR